MFPATLTVLIDIMGSSLSIDIAFLTVRDVTKEEILSLTAVSFSAVPLETVIGISFRASSNIRRLPFGIQIRSSEPIRLSTSLISGSSLSSSDVVRFLLKLETIF